MAKVFVTQENHRLNYSDAERFGEVVFLTASEYSPNANSKRNEQIMDEIRKGLKNFNNATDSLLLSGDPIIMALAFNFVGYVDHCDKASVNVLKWDGQSRRYNQITLNV